MQTKYANKHYLLTSLSFHLVLIIIFSIYFTPIAHLVGEKATVLNSYIYHDEQSIINNKVVSKTHQMLTNKPLSKKYETTEKIKKNLRFAFAKNNTTQKVLSTTEVSKSQGEETDALLILLHTAIQKAQQYPLSAQELGREGRVKVQFILFSTGKVDDLHIIQSSGTDSLDQAALAAVKNATPFEKIMINTK